MLALTRSPCQFVEAPAIPPGPGDKIAHPASPCDECQSSRDAPQAPARDVGRRAAGRRVASDGVAGHQRQPSRPGRDARARGGRHAPAQLPAELGRPGAGHRPLEDARRRQLRHDALRAGVDPVRDRARRARRRLLHHHRQPRAARSRLGAGGDRAAAHAGRGGDPGDRAAGGRGAGAAAGAGRRAAGRAGGRPARRRAARVGRPVRRRLAGHRSPAPARPPDRVAPVRPDRLAGGGRPRARLARRAPSRGRDAAAGAGGRLERPLRPRARAAAGGRPERHGDLRGQRPDGAGRAARAARVRPADPAGRERRGLRRHPRGALLHAAADHGAPGLRRDGPARAAAAAGHHLRARRVAGPPRGRARADRAREQRPAARARRGRAPARRPVRSHTTA
jgi:hypothetical protein